MTSPPEPAPAAPRRLVEILKERGMSAREAMRALETGKVLVQGVPSGDPSREVDEAQVRVDMATPRLHPGKDPFVLWKDEHLVVVIKPPRVLSAPAPGRKDAPVLASLLGKKLGPLLVVHRLDEETSGLMLLARNPQVQHALKAMLERHEVDRRYWALVVGAFPAGERTVRSVLGRAPEKGGRRASIDPEEDTAGKGKAAVTHFERVARLGRASLIDARLETGRTHQVRIHAAELGFPVMGDDLYGGAGAARAASRLALHARFLGFRHPVTGKEMRFEAPLPDDLESLRRKLAKGPT